MEYSTLGRSGLRISRLCLGAMTFGAGRRTKLNFPPIDSARADPIVCVLREIATELNAAPAQVALAWILGRSEVGSVIVGARTPDQLAANLDAQQIALNAAQTERLNQVSPPHLPYPYWMQQFHEASRTTRPSGGRCENEVEAGISELRLAA